MLRLPVAARRLSVPCGAFHHRPAAFVVPRAILSGNHVRCLTVTARHEYDFASAAYTACFGDLPVPDTAALRRQTLEYLAAFDEQTWYDDPVTTMIGAGGYLAPPSDATVPPLLPTVDAFGRQNGRIRMASDADTDALIAHLRAFSPAGTDYRKEVRAVEAQLLGPLAGALIGNQALDFLKQDGVTEMEEATQANVVERRLCDLLLADETSGTVAISRQPAIVCCVSNFSNFLDLFRKALRNMELGVPTLVMSRSNTTQHMFRWTQLLAGLMREYDIDPRLLSYAACDLAQQQRIMRAFPEGAVYITCSRAVAASVRAVHPHVMASTGGPNTLCAPALTPEIKDAVQLSAMIENSGQCTALRHAYVGGGADEAALLSAFDTAPIAVSPAEALAAGAFAGVFSETVRPFPPAAEGYTVHPGCAGVKVRAGGSALPPDGIEEHWREPYVDMTTPTGEFGVPAEVSRLARWLVRNQPISLAMNTRDGDLTYARQLFEETALVVYTVGREGHPALTCQARPQEGEIFGEFPPRGEMGRYTTLPVITPSPNPAYNSRYTQRHLLRAAAAATTTCPAYLQPLLAGVAAPAVQGYCALLQAYLAGACGVHRGNSTGTGGPERTILYGLQRPPLNGQVTVLRCDAHTPLDVVAAAATVFACTNAREGLQVSCHPSNAVVARTLRAAGLTVVAEDDAVYEAHRHEATAYNVLSPALLRTHSGDEKAFPLVGQFVSLYLPMGHIKSTTPADVAFVEAFSSSPKWLAFRT